MRVLVVLPRFGKGGAEKLSCDIVIEMQRHQGVQVKVITFDNENAYPDLTSQLDWQVVPSKIHLSPIRKNTFELEGYTKLLQEFKPDIIHSHLFEAEIISRSVLYPSAKYFSHCHDNMHQFAPFEAGTLFDKKKLIEYYERSYLFQQYRANGGNRFIAISNDTYKYFTSVLPPDLNNVTLIHNAINFSRYNAVNVPRKLDKIRIVNTGSFVAKKNQVFLVEIMKLLKQQGVDAHTTFLGSGPDFQMVRDKTAEYGLNEHITFAGNVQSVEGYLKEANLYVHPAYYEPFGLVLLEAMAAGLPVVSLDGKGNRDLVKDGENGYFITEQNAALFAEKITSLMRNEPLYKQMSTTAVEFARGFDIKMYVEKLLALYRSSLNS